MSLKLVKSLLSALNLAVDESGSDDDQTEIEFGYLPAEGIPIAKSVNKDRHLVTAIVLRPEEPDLHGDIYSYEEVEAACYNFGIYCQKGNLQHADENEDSIRFPENYIAQADFKLGDGEVKKGDWVATMYVPDQEQWDMVCKECFTGFSIRCLANFEMLEEKA